MWQAVGYLPRTKCSFRDILMCVPSVTVAGGRPVRETNWRHILERIVKPEMTAVAYAAVLMLQGCGGSDSTPATPATPTQTALSCDDSMKTAFKPDANTTVLLVKAFKKGDPIALSGTPSVPAPPVAANDLCLVKLNVGPGNPGPASAPSTSAGIGLEIWLPSPANWNGRIHNVGGGGWAGGSQGSITSLGAPGLSGSAPPSTIADTENSVSGSTDTGHSTTTYGSFAMNPDGTINTVGWKDFSERSLHELAIKTKALAAAYYLKSQNFAYWDGCSTGGRQGYKEVQNNPTDYDGYLIGAPAINWTQFLATDQYPAIVTQNDLGGVALTAAQQDLVSGSAVSACDQVGGNHLGYLIDPSSCKYDPRRDPTVLCAGTTIGGVTGTNTTAACVKPAQATAMVKFWYGATADGSVSDPAADLGIQGPLYGQHVTYGYSRGTNTGLASGANGFFLSSDMLGLSLQNPAYASSPTDNQFLGTPPTGFLNATGNGAGQWRSLDYSGFANAINQGLLLQPFFGNIDTNNIDLSAAKAAGVKVIHWHGLADPLITPWGSVNYYTNVQAKMGGYAATQAFDRMFLIPAMGHCGGNGSSAGTAGPTVGNSGLPLPAAGQMFATLVDWVENKKAPASILLKSADGTRSQPICMFPTKATYNGTGDVKVAASYSCK